MARLTYSQLIERHLDILKGLQYPSGLFAASKKDVSTGYDKSGKYPEETVQTMDRIICRAEIRRHDHLNIKQVPAEIQENVFDAIARAACVLARQVNAKAIVPITHSGATAVKISKYRPESRIIAVTSDDRILRSLNLVWSVRGITIKDFIHDNDTVFHRIIERLKQEGDIERGDFVVFTAGLPLMAMGTTDTVNVERVE